MKKYIILEKGIFEKLEKFEERINQMNNYRPINLCKTDAGYSILMERIN